MTAAAGVVLGGRYRLTSLIAVGGMGEVWRAWDERLRRDVAVKLLKPELLHVQAGAAGSLTRFRAEARHAAALSHPGIAAVYDYGETDSQAYLVMELVEGEPLSRLLAREGALPVAEALRIVGLTGLALQAAHEAGVIHRDIKPANLMVVTGSGRVQELQVKITDFGIARTSDSAPLTRTGMVMGTAHYLSPEQARAGTVTPASDVYSLGVVGYEALTGVRPFEGATAYAVAAAHAHQPPPPLPDTIPPAVRDLIERALAKKPGDRPATAGELGRTALALAGQAYPTPAPPPVRPSPAAAPAAPAPATAALPAVGPDRTRRRRLWLIVIAAAVVGALAALAVIATDAARATGPSARDNQTAALRVLNEPATRPLRLGLDPASYAARGQARRVP